MAKPNGKEKEKATGEAKKDENDSPNFVEYFTPDARKLAYFAVLLAAAIIPLFIFSLLVHIRAAYVVQALFDSRSAIAVVATYMFACFSVKREIPLWQSFLVIFVPELIVILAIVSKYGVAG